MFYNTEVFSLIAEMTLTYQCEKILVLKCFCTNRLYVCNAL